jgi:hypothetical protein
MLEPPTMRTLFIATVWMLTTGVAHATEWFVAPGATGSGTSAAPFGRIQDAMHAASPGDTVTIRQGTYNGVIQTVRDGTAALPIRIRAAGSRGSVVVTAPGRVLRVDHPYHIVEGLVLDGQYGTADTVDINSNAHYLILRNTEVRRSSRDLIDIASPRGLLIENCLIHRALNAADGRTDAHGIVAGAVREMTVRNTDIHTFSGDGIQLDPARLAPGWSGVTVELVRIWLNPLQVAENGFAAGVVPGENAIDTKAAAESPRATLTLRDVIAYGFRGGLISNMAAFNIKENVAATIDRASVYGSEIAFRLRGDGSGGAGAWVTIQNAVVYETTTAFRYEDNITNLKVRSSTIGRNVTRPFRAASSGMSGIQVWTLLVLGALPKEAMHSSNRSAGSEAFVNAAAHNYALRAGSSAIDSGIAIPEVKTDRVGVARPQGRSHDVGAYEWR